MQIADWLYNDSNVFLERKYLKYLSAKGFLPQIAPSLRKRRPDTT